MSTLLYTNIPSTSLTPSDTIENATSTVTRVDGEAEASVATTTPEIGRIETDAVTEGGLTTHQVASKVNASERFAPATMSRSDHMDALNNSWSSSGTAAAREAAGQWGHGTAYSQDSLTRIPDGTEFGETYFARDRRAPNEQVTGYMSANNPDPAMLDDISDAGKIRSREANSHSIYQDLYNARMGNT